MYIFDKNLLEKPPKNCHLDCTGWVLMQNQHIQYDKFVFRLTRLIQNLQYDNNLTINFFHFFFKNKNVHGGQHELLPNHSPRDGTH